jgi:hypothetical protein
MPSASAFHRFEPPQGFVEWLGQGEDRLRRPGLGVHLTVVQYTHQNVLGRSFGGLDLAHFNGVIRLPRLSAISLQRISEYQYQFGCGSIPAL